jgi:hypothetical protein
MGTAASKQLELQVADVTGQKRANVRDVPPDSTVGELIQEVVQEMKLSRNDAAGRPLVFHALLEREGRHLHSSEKLTEAVQTGDHLVLHPNVDAASR